MSLLKKLAPRVLPKSLLSRLKAAYYAREVRTFWEPDVEPLKCLIREGDHVLDLGANIGEYTCLLAKLTGQRGMVYAVEPISETFRVLSDVVKKLKLKNVELINCAVSDRNGSAVMEIPKHEYGGSNFYMAHIASGESSEPSLDKVDVPLRKLDSLLPEHLSDKVTFIKCDVEGHELAVLKGAVKFFERTKPVMMIEVAGTPDIQDAPNNEFYAIMKGYGYLPYWFDGKNLRRRVKGHWSVNYFFLQTAHLRQVAHLVAE